MDTPSTPPNSNPPVVVIHNNPHPPRHFRGPVVGGMFVALIFLGVAGIYWHSRTIGDADANQLPAAQVLITSTGFSPSTIKVKKGQQITWTNTDTTPQQAMSPGSDKHLHANDTILNEGESLTITVEDRGTFQYHDALSGHDYKGTVVVE